MGNNEIIVTTLDWLPWAVFGIVLSVVGILYSILIIRQHLKFLKKFKKYNT